MKTLVLLLLAAILLAAFPAMLAAQWPDYPTPGVPHTADGKPDLTAPAPRTTDGHPDLSGLWEFIGFRRQSLSGTGQPPPPPVGGTGLGPRPPGPNQFFDIGSTIGGL